MQLADWQRKALSTAVAQISQLSQLHLSLLAPFLLAPFGKLSLDSKLAYGNLLLEIKRVRLSAQSRKPAQRKRSITYEQRSNCILERHWQH